MEYDSRAQIAVDRRDKRIAELKAEVEQWQRQSNAHYLRVCHLEKREADLEAEVERLRQALNLAELECQHRAQVTDMLREFARELWMKLEGDDQHFESALGGKDG